MHCNKLENITLEYRRGSGRDYDRVRAEICPRLAEQKEALYILHSVWCLDGVCCGGK